MGIGIGLGFPFALGGRPSTFSPTSVSGLRLWLRADLGITTGATFTWADQSGNGCDFTQATGAAQPTVLSGGGPNSQNAIRFDGVDDYLQRSTSIGTFGVNADSQRVDAHVFIVGRMRTGTASNEGVFVCNDGTNSDFTTDPDSGIFWSAGNSGGLPTGDDLYALGRNGTHSPSLLNRTRALDTWYVMTHSNRSGFPLVRRVNGVEVETSAYSSGAPLAATPTRWVIGGRATPAASNFALCDVAEIIVYNSALSGGNVAEIESYLRDRYAL